MKSARERFHLYNIDVNTTTIYTNEFGARASCPIYSVLDHCAL